MDRTNLKPTNPVEQARCLRAELGESGFTLEKFAAVKSLPRTKVSHLLRLLKLPEAVLTLIEKGELTEGHARILLRLNSSKEQTDTARLCVKKHLSVRDLQNLITSPKAPDPPPEIDPNIKAIELKLMEYLAAPTTLNYDAKTTKGDIKITFNNLDILDGILAKIGLNISD